MPRIARHVRVTGQVQGVFFRQSAREKAREAGVGGWIRNCPDGSVEAHVEGEQQAVETMIDWLHRGPPAAGVTRVEVEDTDLRDSEGFEVRR